MVLPSFPRAQQAQIIRANQRDLFHVSSLREQTEAILRTWLGTRWLARWDREVDLITRITYYGITIGRATQTLGEEYTNIWQHSSHEHRSPSLWTRTALILLPSLPQYLLRRFEAFATRLHPSAHSAIRVLPATLEVATEINLAIFYLRGTYYDLAKRVFRIKHISGTPDNPQMRPPSYALLGVLIILRLGYKLYTISKALQSPSISTKGKERVYSPAAERETYLDSRPVSTLLGPYDENAPAKPAEEDENTVLDVAAIPSEQREGRNCTLCLEERTDSCATECGHLFCWSCIVNWGREKPECPLCRQSLKLTRLLPVHNL